MTTEDVDKIQLATEIEKCISICGVTQTARAFGVKIHALRKAIKSGEFSQDMLLKAALLGFFDGEEATPVEPALPRWNPGSTREFLEMMEEGSHAQA